MSKDKKSQNVSIKKEDVLARIEKDIKQTKKRKAFVWNEFFLGLVVGTVFLGILFLIILIFQLDYLNNVEMRLRKIEQKDAEVDIETIIKKMELIDDKIENLKKENAKLKKEKN